MLSVHGCLLWLVTLQSLHAMPTLFPVKSPNCQLLADQVPRLLFNHYQVAACCLKLLAVRDFMLLAVAIGIKCILRFVFVRPVMRQ